MTNVPGPVMTPATPSGLHNHWRCDGACTGPLTLADRELITGVSHRDRDPETGVFCADCLDDLPPGLAQLAHVCAPPPQTGDVVVYHGSLTAYHGTVWEVTHIDGRGLNLFDVDRALRNVRPGSVTVVVQRKGTR